MIKRLTNLPIRQKFAVIIIPLIVIILAFDYLQVRYHYLDFSDSVRLNKAITVGIEINHVNAVRVRLGHEQKLDERRCETQRFQFGSIGISPYPILRTCHVPCGRSRRAGTLSRVGELVSTERARTA